MLHEVASDRARMGLLFCPATAKYFWQFFRPPMMTRRTTKNNKRKLVWKLEKLASTRSHSTKTAQQALPWLVSLSLSLSVSLSVSPSLSRPVALGGCSCVV